MATKSIMNDIVVRDEQSCRSLILALENAKAITGKNVVLSGTYEEVHGALLLKGMGHQEGSIASEKLK